jgi:2-polyprenyl-3-methyl-5-hydroxy-6-metoxy-1,4-benzoquinol methylase
MSVWNERYAGNGYHFGTEPNAFLVSQHKLLKPGMSCLAVADGEGRNGVWLAEQGLDVLWVDNSHVAQAKAEKLAQQRGVKMRFEQADLAEIGRAHV